MMWEGRLIGSKYVLDMILGCCLQNVFLRVFTSFVEKSSAANEFEKCPHAIGDA